MLDDDRVTAWDLTWAAGPQGLHYRAPLDTVIVWLGDGTLRVSSVNGPATTTAVRSGTMRFVARRLARSARDGRRRAARAFLSIEMTRTLARPIAPHRTPAH